MVRSSLEFASKPGTPTSRKTPSCLKRCSVEHQGMSVKKFRDRTSGTIQSLLDMSGVEQPRTMQAPQPTPDAVPDQPNGLVIIDLTSFCHHADPRTRGAQRLHQEHTSHPVLFNSFFTHTVRDWNHLPVTATSAASLQSFRNQLGSSPHNLQPAPIAP